MREGYDAELDEMRALRDHARQVIVALERELVEETGIRSLKIRHNNVLGYYIEVTANHQAVMNGTDALRASSTARPWRAPCASPRPSSPSWRRRSPTPPTAR